MTYAAVTKSNCLYQPRENVKTLIQNNLTYSNIQIYSYMPNVKAVSFKGFPFIVIPDPNNELIEPFEGSNVRQYNNSMEGNIYHSISSLSDNKLRTTKQDIIKALNLKSNHKILAGYGVSNVSIEFDDSSSDPLLIDQNEVIEQGFIVYFDIEVNFA